MISVDGRPVADADDDGAGQFGTNEVVDGVLQTLVERRGGFVEEYHPGPGQHDAGEGDALLLTGGEHLGPVRLLIEPRVQM